LPRRLPFRSPLAKVALAALVAVLALGAAAVRPAPARAATPCWKLLLNDWYDGRIEKTYSVHCYRDALKHLPADVQTYSSAHDDILRALQSAIAKQKQSDKPVGEDTPVPPGGGGGGSGSGSGGSAGNGSGSGGGGTTTTTPTTATNGRQGPGGLADKVGSDDPSSIPVPLLVLGGLALLLVAAGGAGLVAKRMQSRRAQP
jgi:hypothetical protein